MIFSIRNERQKISDLDALIKYCTKPSKTNDDKEKLVQISGINCTETSTLEEFLLTHKVFNKDNAHLFDQFVFSSPPNENKTPLELHSIALEFAKRAWPDHEVLCATHTEKDHIHTHFIVNSINLKTGMTLDFGKHLFQEYIPLCIEISKKHNLNFVEQGIHNKDRMTRAEYWARKSKLSYKEKLCDDINYAMRKSKDKETFIDIMKKLGYDADFNDKYKCIKYTLQNGKSIVDYYLHDKKYKKEAMLTEFRIREEYTKSRDTARGHQERYTKQERGIGTGSSVLRSAKADDGNIPGFLTGTDEHEYSHIQRTRTDRTAYKKRNSGVEKEYTKEPRAIREYVTTGWENEREAFLRYGSENAERSSGFVQRKLTIKRKNRQDNRTQSQVLQKDKDSEHTVNNISSNVTGNDIGKPDISVNLEKEEENMQKRHKEKLKDNKRLTKEEIKIAMYEDFEFDDEIRLEDEEEELNLV